MKTDKLALKQKQLVRLQREVSVLKEKQFRKEVIPARKKLVGTCWRYRNCYSCSNSESDYWWEYRVITGVDGDGGLIAFTFGRDKYGKLTATVNETLYLELSSDWKRMSKSDWGRAWDRARKEILIAAGDL